jgi:GMC oxidoreductase
MLNACMFLLQVGTNLVDKPAILVAGSFPHEFPNAGELYFSHIAAEQHGPNGVQLYEELNAGIDAMLPLSVWQRNFVPTSLRNSMFASSAASLVRFCRRNIRNPLIDSLGPSPLCNQIEPIVTAGCDTRVFGYAALSGEPTSRGSVTLDANGELVVTVNYMTTTHDKTAMGKAARVAFEMLTSHTGPTAPQKPCANKADKQCMSKSCPDLIADYVVFTKRILRLVMPRQSRKFKSAPASVAYPQFLEPALADKANDDEAIGELLSDEIFAAHHFAGSAAVGNVLGNELNVLGVEGLFVVDGSALRTTPRANPMATIMALGRVAGLHAVKEIRA